MRIAIISDIHGNLEALTATLKDIRKRNIFPLILSQMKKVIFMTFKHLVF